MFREALGYPTRSPEGGRSVIVGGLVLVVVSAFLAVAGAGEPYAYVAVIGILPWLLVRGYYVRVIRTTIGRQRPTPPRFDGVKTLLSDGVIAVGISIAYLLPGAIVLGPLIAIQAFGNDLSVILTNSALPQIAVDVIIPMVGIIAVVALMSVLGALYVLPVAVARFAHSGAVADAFEIRTVVSGAMTEDYAIAWGISFVLQAIFLPFAYLFQLVLIGFFFQFIIAVGVRYCYGQGVGAALGLDPVSAPHERSDPNGWALPSAVRRLDTADHERYDRQPRVRPIPAIRRVEEEISEEPAVETFGGGFRPAVAPADDDSPSTETDR